MTTRPPEGGEPDVAAPRGRARPAGRLTTGVLIGLVAGALIAAAAVAFIAQNTESVDMQWLGFDFSWPLAGALFAALAAGVVLAVIGSAAWSLRRRHRARR